MSSINMYFPLSVKYTSSPLKRGLSLYWILWWVMTFPPLFLIWIPISLLISNFFLAPSQPFILPQTLLDNNSEKMKTVFGNFSMPKAMSAFILFIREWELLKEMSLDPRCMLTISGVAPFVSEFNVSIKTCRFMPLMPCHLIEYFVDQVL